MLSSTRAPVPVARARQRCEARWGFWSARRACALIKPSLTWLHALDARTAQRGDGIRARRGCELRQRGERHSRVEHIWADAARMQPRKGVSKHVGGEIAVHYHRVRLPRRQRAGAAGQRNTVKGSAANSRRRTIPVVVCSSASSGARYAARSRDVRVARSMSGKWQ
jgi:hypothetical protein